MSGMEGLLEEEDLGETGGQGLVTKFSMSSLLSVSVCHVEF